MQDLDKIQAFFLESLFDTKNGALAFIASDYPNERLNIYKQTILENLRHALEITYPGIWALLGKECADSAALVFCANSENYPKTGNLDEWGETFPHFLASQPELIGLPYLQDYGQYEWLKHLSYRQANSSAIKLSDLMSFGEQNISNVYLSFHPTVYLYRSDYGLDKILEIIENPDLPEFKLEKIPTYVLVSRSEEVVTSFWIPKDYYVFFQHISKQLKFSDCIENTVEACPNFNISEALNFLIEHKLISSVSLSDFKAA